MSSSMPAGRSTEPRLELLPGGSEVRLSLGGPEPLVITVSRDFGVILGALVQWMRGELLVCIDLADVKAALCPAGLGPFEARAQVFAGTMLDLPDLWPRLPRTSGQGALLIHLFAPGETDQPLLDLDEAATRLEALLSAETPEPGVVLTAGVSEGASRTVAITARATRTRLLRRARGLNNAI